MEIGAGRSNDPRPAPAAPAAPRPSRRYAEQILLALGARSRPTTAQELFTDLRAEGHAAGLATIYRSLHALQQTGRIHAIRRADEVAYRFCSGTRHDHLVCEHCGAVEEVPRLQLDRWFAGAAPSGFQPSADPQQIGAICPRCDASNLE